ncbi:MAG: hypothetical protein D6805_08145 [Planctomycetota bacterium]|nr:MAG: hypothetical protein D6805_08145 [Planctomycetota bacterium]
MNIRAEYLFFLLFSLSAPLLSSPKPYTHPVLGFSLDLSSGWKVLDAEVESDKRLLRQQFSSLEKFLPLAATRRALLLLRPSPIPTAIAIIAKRGSFPIHARSLKFYRRYVEQKLQTLLGKQLRLLSAKLEKTPYHPYFQFQFQHTLPKRSFWLHQLLFSAHHKIYEISILQPLQSNTPSPQLWKSLIQSFRIQPSPLPSPPSRLYTNPALHISLKLPSDWQILDHPQKVRNFLQSIPLHASVKPYLTLIQQGKMVLFFSPYYGEYTIQLGIWMKTSPLYEETGMDFRFTSSNYQRFVQKMNTQLLEMPKEQRPRLQSTRLIHWNQVQVVEAVFLQKFLSTVLMQKQFFVPGKNKLYFLFFGLPQSAYPQHKEELQKILASFHWPPPQSSPSSLTSETLQKAEGFPLFYLFLALGGLTVSCGVILLFLMRKRPSS